MFRYLYRESGLRSLYNIGTDAWLIILSRCTRKLAYSACSLVLALFLAELNVSDERIGMFMSLTILGDVLLSLLLTVSADRLLGRRRTLLVGSLLMITSGTIFALSNNFWLLLFAAVVGVISATGGEIGPFRAVEESTLSELTTEETRPDVLVWYVTTANVGSALGTAVSGTLVEVLRYRPGWSLIDAYHACFWLYTVMGIVNLVCSLRLSDKCELAPKQTAKDEDSSSAISEVTLVNETQPLLQNEPTPYYNAVPSSTSPQLPTSPTPNPPRKPSIFTLFSILTPSTRPTILALWTLLMINSLANGMISISLTTYYLDRKFGSTLPKSALGDILSTAYLLSSTLQALLAAPLSRRFGMINTMVLTHIPSSMAVVFFPFPSDIPTTFALLLLRIGLNSLGQGLRAALIAAIVQPQHRTAVMGVTSVLRTAAGCVGPSVTGVLSAKGMFWVAFLVSGGLRLVYDFGLLGLGVFWGVGGRSRVRGDLEEEEVLVVEGEEDGVEEVGEVVEEVDGVESIGEVVEEEGGGGREERGAEDDINDVVDKGPGRY
ncbi:hypothetical protein HDV00_002954 [Rhizophlyctis rosea]|nr:hypothetical protein HDV00_002954 [Rhizophlyctis rosea]